MDMMQEEREYLQTVLQFLNEQITATRTLLEEKAERAREDNQSLWENERRAVGDFDDLVTMYANSQSNAQLNISQQLTQKNLHDMEKLTLSPYFGRLDFAPEGGKMGTIKAYIGPKAIADTKQNRFYVLDWRSPLASVFYDFDCGPVHFASPSGEQRGEMLLKRQYKIQLGELQGVFVSDALVKDEILQHILTTQSAGRLKSIAQSIQKEQNQAIRMEAHGDLLIYGPAGSGKTSVGLHRMAYLLYHQKQSLQADQILAISANQAFNEYIAGILPDLYEEDLGRQVFDDLLAEMMDPGYVVESAFEQVEYLLGAKGDEERLGWLAAVYDGGFLQSMLAFMRERPLKFEDVRVRGQVVASAADFEKYMTESRAVGLRRRMERAQQYIRLRIDEHFHYQAKEIRAAVQRRIDNEELDIYSEDELKAYIRMLHERAVEQNLAAFHKNNGLRAERLLLGAVRQYKPAFAQGLKERLLARRLHYEDMLALLVVRAFMGEIAPRKAVNIVLVDEAQDYGLPQQFLLRTLFPNCRFTFLADVNQAILPLIGIGDIQGFSFFAKQPLESCYLSKSYRSTGPIGRLAASMIAPKEPISFYEREGKEPVRLTSQDLCKTIDQLLETEKSPMPTAILTTTMAQAQDLFARLRGRHHVQLVTEGTGSFVEGAIRIVPLYLAKGMEYDRVIAVLPVEGEHPMLHLANANYLMCTRALHELYLVEREAPV